LSVLSHWDSGWYLKITTQGYDSASAAFLPLFPLTMRWISSVFNFVFQFQISQFQILLMGSVFSAICFSFALMILQKLQSFCGVLTLRLDASRFKTPQVSKASNPMLLFLFIASPAAYVFHSFHTESLFLLASVLAFKAFEQKLLLRAAIFCGIASLIRHQGVFLAISLALFFDTKNELNVFRFQWLRNFVLFGFISGSIWFLSAVFHYSEGRPLFPWLGAHSENWYIASSLTSYFKTFFLANPIQNFGLGSILRQLFAFAALAGTIYLFKRKHFAEATYCALSLLIMPLQGEFVDVFRFSAVLFPLYFVLAEAISRISKALTMVFLLCYLALNLAMAYAYALPRWAY
jgi:Gpi18-like mannosyltransferase